MNDELRYISFIFICVGLIFVWLTGYLIVKHKEQTIDREVKLKTKSLEGEI